MVKEALPVISGFSDQLGKRAEKVLIKRILHGGLNNNIVYEYASEKGKETYVARIPKEPHERLQTSRTIQHEYDEIGATGIGIGFRLRDISEQAKVIDELGQNKFNVLGYDAVSNNAMLLPYIEAIPLSEFVGSYSLSENLGVVIRVLDHLRAVHSKGIVMGDRWCRNTLVTGRGTCVEIDFDIELLGDSALAKTFELSQVLYHLVHFSNVNRETMVQFLLKYLNKGNSLLGYNKEALKFLLQGHAEFFKGNIYEKLEPPYGEVYDLISHI